MNLSNQTCSLLSFSRFKIRENIAVTHIITGQYVEATQAYESIVQERPNYRSCFNLFLCYYTLGQRDKARTAFSELLKIPFVKSEDESVISVRQIHYSYVFIEFLWDNCRWINKISRQVWCRKQYAMIV